MRRYARAGAALFGLVTGVIGLAQLGISLGAASGFVLALLPLVLLSATSSGLLALGSGALLARGDRARLGGRVAGVLLAGTALGYVPLVVITSPDVAVGAILPALAAVILLVTSRDPGAGRDLRVTPAERVGRLLLLGVAVAAIVWAAIRLAGIAADGSISGLGGYAGVRAMMSLAAVHAALALVAGRLASVALVAAGALDVALGFWATPTEPISLLGALLVAGVVLLALGFASERQRRRGPALGT